MVRGATRNRPQQFLCALLSSSRSEEIERCIAQATESGLFPWTQFIDVATDQLLAPAAAWALEHRGLDEALPDAVNRYLRSMYRLNRLRNAWIERECVAITTALNRVGVRPVFFKGSGRLLTRFYDDPAIRIMSDIDILVPERRSGDCIDRLASCGYGVDTSPRHPKDQSFTVLYPPSGGLSVDVHRSVVVYPYDRLLTPDEVFAEAVEHQRAGAVFAVPSPTHQVIINIGHAELHHNHGYIYGRLALRSLYDMALAVGRWTSEVDWQDVASRFAGIAGARRWSFICSRLANCSARGRRRASLRGSRRVSISGARRS